MFCGRNGHACSAQIHVYYILYYKRVLYRQRKTKGKIIHVTVDPSHIVYGTQLLCRYKLLL